MNFYNAFFQKYHKKYGSPDFCPLYRLCKIVRFCEDYAWKIQFCVIKRKLSGRILR